MTKNKYEKNTGIILIDSSGDVLYSSSNCKYETNNFLKEIRVFDRIRTENFGMKMCGKYKVFIERILITNQTIYVVEFMNVVHTDSLLPIEYKDLMSGLYNRNMWEHLLKDGWKELRYQFNALVIIDIDNLKEVNDREGYAVGDRIIKIVADSIKESIRSKDIAFRYGGDEFTILLNDLKNNNINKLVDRIKRRLCKNAKDNEIRVSIGTTILKDLSELQIAFQKANQDLYEEKQYKKLQIINEKYYELAELKETIEETRGKLNDLVVVKQNHLSEDILDLSRKLDHMIYRYAVMEINLKSMNCQVK
ncbi:diguanylate cyclase (GGDEF) domain-containing protein [Anaerovirgula multivorans]|uniref:Diguanylate cyclase (GGDEF) domain-containing protein n=1 Tax=Anaerovirgula multivorans TaxID=312168 RepID=A0A239JLH7_9FIRM|nr:diguanylate cyclase [Anaerovirgula multivorans]SNT06258.1 diguanylate cyclase (GGDEF) domain-containing protein [Anaerovirgula multivorans]